MCVLFLMCVPLLLSDMYCGR
ncbi:BnaA05g08330D [Brassica napus]|uniref:BnaA05g08330D protein n=1 Tax=Brassica napus TaxID=3708 RepID=A0A078H2S3_BRANA|nr:BnaA05g08330D [Brassica napus]